MQQRGLTHAAQIVSKALAPCPNPSYPGSEVGAGDGMAVYFKDLDKSRDWRSLVGELSLTAAAGISGSAGSGAANSAGGPASAPASNPQP